MGAAQWSIALNITVLPCVAGSSGMRTLTAADMTPALGYELHKYVAMGGTFDRLHSGHKLLLSTAAFGTGERLRIGVAGPALLKNKKHAELLQPVEVRRVAVEEFVMQLRRDLVYEIVELMDSSGGTDTIADVEAMVVSPETLPAVEKINAERRQKGFRDMVPVLIDYIGGGASTRVSSTMLREIELQRGADPNGTGR